jgi:hypothetical protein
VPDLPQDLRAALPLQLSVAPARRNRAENASASVSFITTCAAIARLSSPKRPVASIHLIPPVSPALNQASSLYTPVIIFDRKQEDQIMS